MLAPRSREASLSQSSDQGRAAANSLHPAEMTRGGLSVKICAFDTEYRDQPE